MDLKLENKMDAEEILMREFVKTYRYTLYWPLKIMGFCRYDIEDNTIVQLKLGTLMYNTFLLCLANSCAAFITYSAILNESYLKPADAICMIHFGAFANMNLVNLTFINRSSGEVLIKCCNKIDACLGVKETEFVRNIDFKTTITQSILVFIANILVGMFLYNVYEVPMYVHIPGSLYYFWLFFVYNDYTFYSSLQFFLTLRVRYLNVALSKYGNMKEDCLPDGSIFNGLFWRKQYNKLVKAENISKAQYLKTFHQICIMTEILEKYYTFPLLLGVWTIVMGTFVAIQTFIIRVKYSTMLELGRTLIVVGWVSLSWGFLFYMSTFIGMLQQQINQTKLICSYIQLKPNLSDETYKLTKLIFRMLSETDPRPAIYHMFYVDTGFVFRLAAATLVYITVQLQMAFPQLSVRDVHINKTST